MRVVFTGGGSGGHLTPLEPIIDILRSAFKEKRGNLPAWVNRKKLDLYFIGVVDKRGRQMFSRLGVNMKNIPAAKIRRYASAMTIVDVLFRLPLGAAKALWVMWQIMPDVVVSKGGYGSVPVTAAAFFYRIPVLLHESDTAPGLANKYIAFLASVVTVSSTEARQEMKTFSHKTVVTGVPVRAEIGRESQEEAKRHFGMAGKTVLFVTGGSQGAEQINNVVLEALDQLIGKMAIIHQTGSDNLERVQAQARKKLESVSHKELYKAIGYLKDGMGTALAAADVVVSRAGATALAEIARAKKPAIVIPLQSSAQDHQRRNAMVYEAADAVRVIAPENLGRSIFIQNVMDLVDNEGMRKTLVENISLADHPNAGKDIVSLILKLASGYVPHQPTGKRRGK